MRRAGRLSLRKFRTGKSKESYAFSAALYLDGVEVGEAENDGNGGECMVWINPAHRDAMDAWLATLPDAISIAMSDGNGWYSRTLQMCSIDLIVDLLAEGATFPEGFGQ